MTMKTTLAAFALLLALLSHADVFAQPDHRNGPNRRNGPSQERLEMLKLWRFVDELEITEEQSVRLFPALSAHRRAVRDLQAKHRAVGEDLERLLQKEGVSDGKLRDKMGDLRLLESQESELKSSFHKQLEGLLSVRQQAQFQLFEGRFRGDLRGIVRQFRELEGGDASAPYRRGRGFRQRRPDEME